MTLRRLLLLLGLLVSAALVNVTTGVASHSPAKLQLRKTSVGTILVDGRGYTLYAFTPDRRNKNACVQRLGCSAVWPAFTSASKPLLGPGVKARLLGSLKLPGGSRQVTYGGHPLYRYMADYGPGETFYVNILQFGGRWPAVNAAGHAVK